MKSFSLILLTLIFVSGITALPLALAPKTKPPADPAIGFVRDNNLWVMNVDGSNQVQIYSPPLCKFCIATLHTPSWSPDGKSIAFTEQSQLWRIDVVLINGVPTGTNLMLLADRAACGGGAPGGSCTSAAWSPAGNEIASSGIGNNLRTIIVIPAGGGAVSTLFTANPGEGADGPAWSSDATRIAFRFFSSSGVPSIRILDRATGAIVGGHFVEGMFDDMKNIDWARQGRDILVFNDFGQQGGSGFVNPSVYMLDLTTGVVTRLATGFSGSWSPDNSKIVYTSTEVMKRTITVLNLADGSTAKLTNGVNPDWRRF